MSKNKQCSRIKRRLKWIQTVIYQFDKYVHIHFSVHIHFGHEIELSRTVWFCSWPPTLNLSPLDSYETLSMSSERYRKVIKSCRTKVFGLFTILNDHESKQTVILFKVQVKAKYHLWNWMVLLTIKSDSWPLFLFDPSSESLKPFISKTAHFEFSHFRLIGRLVNCAQRSLQYFVNRSIDSIQSGLWNKAVTVMFYT